MLVTARSGVTRGDSDSSYAACSEDKRCMTGFVDLKFSQASARGEVLTETSAWPAL